MRTLTNLLLTSLIVLWFSAPTAHAEYRVFTLMISNEQTKENKQFDSTLDPDQYKSFYPLSPGEKITYLKTWRCKGRTSHFKPHCDAPTTDLVKN